MNKIKVVGEFLALQAYIDGFPDFANFVAGDSLLLAGGIDVDPLLPLLSTEKASHQIPIVKGHDAVAENPIYVAVGIEHIFAQAL